MKVLVLAGTAEGRELSHRLEALADVEVVVALAGRTSAAAEHGGTVRVGGFGGVDGLVRYLSEHGVDAVVDATHPFAATISANAAQAAERCGAPRLRLVRAPWRPREGDRWVEAADMGGAAAALRELGSTSAFLTVGRMELDAFAGMDHVRFVVRTIEPPEQAPLADAVFVAARGPFSVADEVEVLRRHHVEALVTKNSGGHDAKLAAARQLGIPVVMVRRPAAVAGPAVERVDDAVGWVRSQRTGGGAARRDVRG